jgi:hypothetical protein
MKLLAPDPTKMNAQIPPLILIDQEIFWRLIDAIIGDRLDRTGAFFKLE